MTNTYFVIHVVLLLKVMPEKVMVKSHLTLRGVIYRSFGIQFKTLMVDHVTQGFKGVTGRVDNQTIKQ